MHTDAIKTQHTPARMKLVRIAITPKEILESDRKTKGTNCKTIFQPETPRSMTKPAAPGQY
jgi:hypothetical protein